MNFNQALEHLKQGEVVARNEWDNQYLLLIKGVAIRDAVIQHYGNPEKPEDNPKVADSIWIYEAGMLKPYQLNTNDSQAEDWHNFGGSHDGQDTN